MVKKNINSKTKLKNPLKNQLKNQSDIKFEDMKKLAFNAVTGAGLILEDFFYKSYSIKIKSHGDIVTQADLASEKYLIDSIKKKYPNANIYSEEAGGKVQAKKDEYHWIMDPLDGTNNFSSGIASFFIVLGIVKNNEIIFVIDYQPITKQMYWAQKGKGAFLGQKKIHVRKNSRLTDIECAFGILKKTKNAKELMKSYVRAYDLFFKSKKTGCIGMSIAAIASGKMDANITNFMSLHDGVILSLLVEEAGGKVTDLQGNKLTPKSDAYSVYLYSNGVAHNNLIKYFKKFIALKNTKKSKK